MSHKIKRFATIKDSEHVMKIMKTIPMKKVQNFLPPPIDNDFTGNLLLSAAINQSQGGEIALSQDTTLFPFIQWENLYKKFKKFYENRSVYIKHIVFFY